MGSHGPATFTILGDLVVLPGDMLHAKEPPGKRCYAVIKDIEMDEPDQTVLKFDNDVPVVPLDTWNWRLLDVVTAAKK